MNKTGRPLKYKTVLKALEPNTVYTPAAIARFAEENRVLSSTEEPDQKVIYQRIRVTMARFARSHQFPREGDGLVFLPGLPPTPGWLGSRWTRATETNSN